AFVARLNSTGSALVYCSYLGGSNNDLSNAVAVSTYGDVYIAGYTISANLKTTSPFQSRFGGQSAGTASQNGDAFIAKIGRPRITSASVSGKKLIVVGENFDGGAVILVNGQKQKTRDDEEHPGSSLIGKKSGRQILPG